MSSRGEAWRWVQFTTESGLPADAVYDMVEALDGTIWVATSAGLAWYDGFTWDHVSSSEGVPGKRPSSLAADASGGVLVVIGGRLFQVDRSRFRELPAVTGPIGGEIIKAVPFDDSSLLLLVKDATSAGVSLYLYQAGRIEAFEAPGTLDPRVGALWRTAAGRIWVSTSRGLYRWSRDGWQLERAVATRRQQIVQLVENAAGYGMAFVSHPREERGLWEWDGASPPTRARREGENLILAMDISRSGEAVVAYETGDIRVRRAGVWTSMEQLPQQLQDVLLLKFQRNGNLWAAGQRGLFLHRRSARRWTHRRHPFPGLRNRVNALLRSADGSLWLGTGDGVEIQRRDGRIDWITHIDGTRLGDVTGLAEDAEGHVWISSGSTFAGAYRLDGTGWRHFGDREGLASPRIHRIETDRLGRLWFLGLSDESWEEGPGAFVLTSGRFERWGTEQGLLSGRVYAFAQTPDGALWFGIFGGLSRWRGGHWTHWTRQAGVRGPAVFALAVDHRGQLWFGDRRGGLGYVDSADAIGYLSTDDGLSDDEVWEIRPDGSGRLWVATRNGLCSLSEGVWACFGTRVGLGNPRVWAILPERDQVIAGTVGNGLEILSLEEAANPSPRVVLAPPMVEEDRVHLMWKAFAYWGTIASADIETRYRIDRTEWSRWNRLRGAELDGLPAGAHSLQVQAKGLFGQFDDAGAVVSFVVPPPLYRRPQFAIPVLGLSAALLVLGMLALWRRRKSDLALRRSDAALQSVFRAAPIGIGLLVDQVIRWTNDAFEVMVGYANGELAGKRAETLYEGDGEFERVESQLHGQIRELRRGSIETRLKRKDGNLIDALVSAAPLDPGDLSAGLTLTALDITGRKHAEEALRRAALEYRRVVDNISDALIVQDEQGRIVFANDRFLELVHFQREDLPGLGFENFVAPDWRREIGERHARRIRGEEVGAECEYEGVKRDGTRVWLEARVVPVMQEGRVVGTQSTIRDISERRQAEQALRHSKAELQQVIENAPSGIFRATPEGRFLLVNPALVEMLGYDSEEEVLGLDLMRDVYLDPAERQAVMEEAIRLGEVKGAEVEWKRKGGETIRVRLNARPAYNAAGELVFFEDVAEDVTEQRRLEEQLRQAQKMEAIGVLTGGIAHDFNNVLTSILGNSELLLADLPVAAPEREGLKEIEEAAQRAAALTRQLLAFSRRQVLQPRILNLNEVVRNLEKMLRRLIGEDVELATQLDPALGNVEVDPGQIEQVIMNLAVNARDAMPEGGDLTIETRNVEVDGEYVKTHPVVVPGRYAMLAVSDTGVGMDAATRSRIFDPFFTTKELGKGTGLGLSTVYGIVKQSGGYIWVYSEPGRGATFKIYFPRVEEAVETLAARAPAAEELAGWETVLLVEDDEAVRAISRTALVNYGYSVIVARDGREALEVCMRHRDPIHLLITDLVMPGMSGTELAGRAAALHPELKVLYVSGYTDHAVLRRGVLEPGLHFVQKPFTPSALAREVRKLLAETPLGISGKSS